MSRRRLTIKRLDPWSVLKFGAVANVILLAVVLLTAGVVWFIVDRLELIEQACDIARDVGFTACGVEAGGLFRALGLLGLLWAVVQTAVLVFFAFLHNLIADLTGGLVIGVVDDAPPPREAAAARAAREVSGPVSGRMRQPVAADASVDNTQPQAGSGPPQAPPGDGYGAPDAAVGQPDHSSVAEPPRSHGDELFVER